MLFLYFANYIFTFSSPLNKLFLAILFVYLVEIMVAIIAKQTIVPYNCNGKRAIVNEDRKEKKPLFTRLANHDVLALGRKLDPSTPRFRSPLTIRFYVRTTFVQATSLQTSFRVPPLCIKGIGKFHRLSLPRQMSVFVPFVWYGRARARALIGGIAGSRQCPFEKIKKPVVRSRKSHFLDRLFESERSEP